MVDNNTVQNVQQPVLPDEKGFNDEDILQDVLCSLKHLSTLYGLLCQEASHEQFMKQVESIKQNISTMARASYNLMFEKGWYSLKKQPNQNQAQTYQKFHQKMQNL